MHLLRVQIPKFRALENVDITFEKEFVPRIFPVGSLNGGGKSTLLQLIFTLLHCSGDSQKTPYLANLLETFQPLAELETITTLATIEIEDEGQIYKLQFFCCPDDYVSKQLNINSDNVLLFSKIQKLKKEAETTVLNFQSQLQYLQSLVGQAQFIQTLSLTKGIEQIKLLYRQRKDNLIYIDAISFEKINPLISSEDIKKWCETMNNEVESLITTVNYQLVQYESLAKKIFDQFQKVNGYLQSQGLSFITNYHLHTQNNPYTLLCSINNLNEKDVFLLLKKVATKVFLLAQPTQRFLFLPIIRSNRLTLDYQTDYQEKIEQAKQQLPGFFTFGLVDVEAILNLFKEARDKDFQIAMETEQYGSYLQQLTKEFNNVFGNKIIKILKAGEKDFSAIKFQEIKNGQHVDINLEDLSHGELRRFSLYAWLKIQNRENAIILIDEIETGLHPDWQFKIINNDLQDWAPHSQFILATHSYDVCQALAPAHVKELPPKLIKTLK